MKPLARLEAALASHGCRKSGRSSWQCLAHDDETPSLSVTEAPGGKVLLKCHAGCSTEAIVAALGLRLSDLFPGEPTSAQETTTKSRGFASESELVAFIEKKSSGRRVKLWRYVDDSGKQVFSVGRFEDLEGNKTYRPWHCVNARHVLGDPPGRLPLYRLDTLEGAELIIVTEGEKAADAARSLGFTVTTSAHGSQSAGKSDWAPLAGKAVAILPDHDEPGRKYAETVAEILRELDPPATVKIVELPGLDEHEDVVEWLECGGTKQALRGLIDVTKEWCETQDRESAIDIARVRQIDLYVPFPLNVLPEGFRRHVDGVAKSVGCDPSFVALPALGAFAAGIGNTFAVQLKRGWVEPPTLWLAVVAPSGAKKTPPFDAALEPLVELESRWVSEHSGRMLDYERQRLMFERELSRWKKSKTLEDPPDPPDEPDCRRIIARDITIEALSSLHARNPRGLLLGRDELAGWLGSFDAYKTSRGCDVPQWLQAHRAGPWSVDRKSNKTVLLVPRVSVSIVGTIQPEVLRRCLGTAYLENGLAARLLLAMPPVKACRWTELEVGDATKTNYAKLFEDILDIPLPIDSMGRPDPRILELDRSAKAEWVRFYNKHGEETAGFSGPIAAVWSKLEGEAARLALILHIVAAAEEGRLPEPGPVSARAMQGGIQLAEWFGHEARRVHAMIRETTEEGRRRRLLELLQRIGEPISVRDLIRRSRLYGSAAEARTALDELEALGLGTWRSSMNPKGGRPGKVFVVSPEAPVDGTNVDRTPEVPWSPHTTGVSGDEVLSTEGGLCRRQNSDGVSCVDDRTPVDITLEVPCSPYATGVSGDEGGCVDRVPSTEGVLEPDEIAELIEERASIIQEGTNCSRSEADRRAAEEILGPLQPTKPAPFREVF